MIYAMIVDSRDLPSGPGAVTSTFNVRPCEFVMFTGKFIIESVELLVKSIGVDGTLDCMTVVVIFTVLVVGRAAESIGEAVAG